METDKLNVPASDGGTDRSSITTDTLQTLGSVLCEYQDSPGQNGVMNGSVDDDCIIPNVKKRKGATRVHARCISEPLLFTAPTGLHVFTVPGSPTSPASVWAI